MSADELRARIEEISSEIGLQKQLLKKLQHDKSVVQRQLNEVVDPMARLPLEISSDIFLQCLDPVPERGVGPCQAPILFLNICSGWTAIALCTPELWSAIEITFPCAKGLTQLLPIWFQRARTHPLSISFRGDVAYLNDPVAAIWGHGGQIKHLEIWDDYFDVEDGSDHANSIDLVGDMTPESLPLLKTLTVRTSNYRVVFVRILELLRLSPNIVECFFDRVEFSRNSKPDSTEKLVLQTLRRLAFGDPIYHPDKDELLNCLTLPALEALHVVAGDDLLRFFKRSSPPLQELGVLVEDYPYSFLQDSLHIIPTLSRLALWFPGPQFVANLFTALYDFPSLLPNLLSLTIEVGSEISDSAWRTVPRAMRSRRIQLRILNVEVPPADVLAAFRELVVDGEIHIGTQKCNFLDSLSEEAT
jgi:hypothetical protein